LVRRELRIDEEVFASERSTGHRNRAIAFLELSTGMIDEPVDDHLDLYFAQCSILVTARDLAMMAATLAEGETPLGAGERMTLKVSPAVAFAPANLVVRATIPADADNRAVEIVAESNDFYRSSQIQLEGEKAARTSMFEFRSLPSGTYEVRANLLGADGRSRAMIRQQINVIASGAGDHR